MKPRSTPSSPDRSNEQPKPQVELVTGSEDFTRRMLAVLGEDPESWSDDRIHLERKRIDERGRFSFETARLASFIHRGLRNLGLTRENDTPVDQVFQQMDKVRSLEEAKRTATFRGPGGAQRWDGSPESLAA